jgi:thiol-disulfide isomerase/thioredoxin
MRRMIPGLLVLALAAVLARGGEDRKVEKSPALVFKQLSEEMLEEANKAKSREELAKTLKKYSLKVLALAQKNRKEPFAFDALALCLRMSLGEAPKDSPAAKALALLRQDHARDKRIGQVFLMLKELPEESTVALLEAVAEKNPVKKVRAQAIKTLILVREQLVQTAERIKADKDARQALVKSRGKSYVKDLQANAGKYRKQMLDLDKKLQDKYPGMVKVLFVGKKAPEVVSQDLDGKKVRLSDLKGKVVVLDIWDTRFEPSKAMIPHLRQLVKRLKGKPLVLVGINADARKETLERFLEDNPMPWTHWYNGATGGILKDWDVTYLPTVYVLDARGVIRYKDVRGKDLDRAVDALLKGMKEDKKRKKADGE